MAAVLTELEKVTEYPGKVKNTLDELQKAKEVMISIHMPIVINMALKFSKQFHIKLFMEDLINAGKLGLENALECFIPQIHGKFSTHCLWYVKACIEDVCKLAELEYIERQAKVN